MTQSVCGSLQLPQGQTPLSDFFQKVANIVKVTSVLAKYDGLPLITCHHGNQENGGQVCSASSFSVSQCRALAHKKYEYKNMQL